MTRQNSVKTHHCVCLFICLFCFRLKIWTNKNTFWDFADQPLSEAQFEFVWNLKTFWTLFVILFRTDFVESKNHPIKRVWIYWIFEPGSRIQSKQLLIMYIAVVLHRYRYVQYSSTLQCNSCVRFCYTGEQFWLVSSGDSCSLTCADRK